MLVYPSPYRFGINSIRGAVFVYLWEDMLIELLKIHNSARNMKDNFIKVNLIKARWFLYECYRLQSQSDEYSFSMSIHIFFISNVLFNSASVLLKGTNADLKMCQYLRLHMKIICWRFHNKTPFNFWDLRRWHVWKVCLQTFRNNRIC